MQRPLPPEKRKRHQDTARRPSGVPLPWIERAAIDYLRLGPLAVGFAELCRDEQLAVLRMASALAVAGSPGRAVAGRWWAA
jgi:hypothetical protein